MDFSYEGVGQDDYDEERSLLNKQVEKELENEHMEDQEEFNLFKQTVDKEQAVTAQ